MSWRWLSLVLLAVLLGSCAASWMQFKSIPMDGSQPQTVTGLLRVPAGGGRFPAIVLLPDCDGIGPHERRWGRDLTQAGFVTYVIDSHFTRHVEDGCAAPLAHEILVADALGALARLAEFEGVDPDRMAVIGWGRGGDVALDIVSSAQIRPATGGLKAAVAFYPTCEDAGPVRRPAILVLPELYPGASLCRAYAEAQTATGEAPVRYVSPGGVGAGFDCEFCVDGYLGQENVYDRPATETVREMLIEELGGLFYPGVAP